MKLKSLFIGILPLSFVLTLSMHRTARAVCIGLDIPTQIAIHGAGDESTQYSESQFAAEPGCTDAVTVNTGTQVYSGYGDIHQEQVNYHQLGGGEGSSYYPATDPVFVSVPTQINLDVLPDESYWNEYDSDSYSAGYSSHSYDGTYGYDQP